MFPPDPLLSLNVDTSSFGPTTGDWVGAGVTVGPDEGVAVGEGVGAGDVGAAGPVV